VGLAVGKKARHILRLAGIQDAWGFTEGKTKTTVNYSKAAFNALMQTTITKITEGQIRNLNITTGAASVIGDLPVDEAVAQELAEEIKEGDSETKPVEKPASPEPKKKD
jgi:hypothetical protein